MLLCGTPGNCPLSAVLASKRLRRKQPGIGDNLEPKGSSSISSSVAGRKRATRPSHGSGWGKEAHICQSSNIWSFSISLPVLGRRYESPSLVYALPGMEAREARQASHICSDRGAGRQTGDPPRPAKASGLCDWPPGQSFIHPQR